MQGSLNLQARLAMLVVAAILPLAALSVWFAVSANQAAISLAQAQLKFSASVVAAHQDRMADSAQQLLSAVATMPDLRDDPSRCAAYLERMRVLYPVYSNIGILDLDGKTICHANERIGVFNASERSYFHRVLAERRPVMGEAILGQMTGRPAIPFAQPVMEAGKLLGVAFIALDLPRAAEALAGLDLPEGASVVVADRRGRVLMEHPSGAAASRRAAPALPQLPKENDRGAGELRALSGPTLLYGYAASRQINGEGFVASVTMDRARITQPTSAKLRNELLVLAITLLSGIAAAWWIGGRVIVKPAKQILGAVRRLDARVPLQGGLHKGEFARIAAAFNLMAESLQLRQMDLETELGRSRSAYGVLDQVLNSMQEGLIAITNSGQFLMFNQAAAKLLPLDGPSMPLRQWPAHFGLYKPDGTTLYLAEELPLSRAMHGESGRPQLLFVRNSLVPEGRLLQASAQAIRGEDGAVSGGLVVFTDVTELQRLQAEQAAQFEQLRETQRKLIEAQRIGRVGNWEVDLGTGRLWWSDEVYELFGLSREEFIPTLNDFVARVYPDDRALLKPARDSALRDGKVMRVEYRVLKPDGTVIWMREIAETRRDGDGRPIWFGGVVQDITDQKRNEQALLDSQQELHGYTLMLQRAAEAAQAITARPTLQETMQEVVDQARRVVEAHQAVISLSQGNDWSQVVTSVSLSDKYARWREYEGKPDGSGVYALVCETGQALRLTKAQLQSHPRWRALGAHAANHPPILGLLAVPLTGRDGKNIGLLQMSDKREGEFTERDQYVALELAQLAATAIENAALFTQVRDLNAGLEARIAERTAELAQQEKLYRTLAEQAPEVVWNTDARGATTFINHAWYDLVGGQPGEWLGAGWLKRVHPEDVEDVRRKWAVCQQTLQPFSGTRRIMARDGSYHTMSYNAVPVLDDQGKVAFWVGIDTDVTEFKAIESALRSSNQELEAFSYSVSHDLRAPLGAVGGFNRALALKLEGHPDERVRHYLERIQAGVEKMEQLIESLLSLAKVVRAPLSYGPVDLAAMALEILEDLRGRDPQRAVTARIQDALVAQGDARLLRVVMENLLGNAWKFSSRTQAAEIEVGKLEDSAVFFVRDNGVGFDMAYAGKLFGAFQRLHTQAEFPGTGIGLATVRRVVARHQGRVWAESELGQGTTFFFVLSGSAPPAWLAGDQAAPAG
jgi:PAS domain S-box-containing protein